MAVLTSPIDIDRLLDMDPEIYDGWVRIRGREVTVSRLGFQHIDEGMTPAELAEDWEITLAEVHAALAYFFAHQEELERQVEEYNAETERVIAAWPNDPD